MVRLFKWRTKRESQGVRYDFLVIVGPDVGIVAMRTFIEMTADSKKVKAIFVLFCHTIVYSNRIEQEDTSVRQRSETKHFSTKNNSANNSG